MRLDNRFREQRPFQFSIREKAAVNGEEDRDGVLEVLLVEEVLSVFVVAVLLHLRPKRSRLRPTPKLVDSCPLDVADQSAAVYETTWRVSDFTI